MVKNPKKIPPKPNLQLQKNPAVEAWLNEGGQDPELQSSQGNPPQQPVVEPAQPIEKKGKPYPHRISFDMETQQYKRLKRASFETDQSMNELLREAVEDWLRASNY